MDQSYPVSSDSTDKDNQANSGIIDGDSLNDSTSPNGFVDISQENTVNSFSSDGSNQNYYEDQANDNKVSQCSYIPTENEYSNALQQVYSGCSSYLEGKRAETA